VAAPYRYQHGDKPLEGYTVLRGIGRGGFGEVYYAISDGGREVALKVIQQNHDVELRGVSQCINLKSPHLVSIFDIKSNADGTPFVIMEYVAGPSLRDFVPKDPSTVPKGQSTLGMAKAVFLMREISKGLGYLHERGIVHRDLKPENIFYEDGYVKIGDYGLSKYISVSRQSGQTISVGTVHYMAPEIGSGNYHQGIDVYALGVIFYELLTGTVPFNGDSMGEILMKHLTSEPDVSAIDPLLRPVVKKALEKDPAKRYQSTKEMVAAALANGELANKVARIDPQSITSLRSKTASVADSPPVSPAIGVGARGPVVERPPPPSEAKPAAGDGPQEASPGRGDASPNGFSAKELDRRLVPGVATAAAMALAIGLVTKNSGISAVGGYLAVIFIGAGAILAVQQWFIPRFSVRSDTLRRLVTLGLVGPVLACSLAALAAAPVGLLAMAKSIPALLAGLLCVDWNQRVRPDRPQQVSLGSALSAGLFGLVAAAIARGSMGLTFGLLAALSLVLNTVTFHTPRARRGKHWTRGAGQHRRARKRRSPKEYESL